MASSIRIEAEYMHDFEGQEDSFTYAWSELGFSPLEVAALRHRRPALARL